MLNGYIRRSIWEVLHEVARFFKAPLNAKLQRFSQIFTERLSFVIAGVAAEQANEDDAMRVGFSGDDIFFEKFASDCK